MIYGFKRITADTLSQEEETEELRAQTDDE